VRLGEEVITAMAADSPEQAGMCYPIDFGRQEQGHCRLEGVRHRNPDNGRYLLESVPVICDTAGAALHSPAECCGLSCCFGGAPVLD